PALRRFEFDFFGRTAFYYTYCVVLLAFLLLRYLLRSPFGLALAGIQQNPYRMSALGASVSQRLTVAYVISAAWAGLAGGLLAQTTQFVGVETIGFERSAEVLIILILGGTRSLYGGFVGAAIYLILRDQFASLSPQYWMLGLGVVLMGVALSRQNGLLGIIRDRRIRQE